jgi:hypothetical protein
MKTANGNYRITPQDITHAFTLISKEFSDGQQLKPREAYLERLGFQANVMQRESGVYPTVQEVHERWDSDRKEAERKRIASWRSEGRITDFDFSEYAQQVADGLDGPFVIFMRVADELRQAGRIQLTVGDVRTAMRTLNTAKEKI